MSVTASGIISTAPALLRTQLSALTATHTFLGVANSTEALNKIKLSVFDGWTRPCIVIGFSNHKTSNSGYAKMHLSATFFRDVPAEYANDANDAWLDFCNLLGAVVHDLAEDMHNGSGKLIMGAKEHIQTGIPVRSRDNGNGESLEGTDFTPMDFFECKVIVPVGGEIND